MAISTIPKAFEVTSQNLQSFGIYTLGSKGKNINISVTFKFAYNLPEVSQIFYIWPS
jgi:hypothetical protein